MASDEDKKINRRSSRREQNICSTLVTANVPKRALKETCSSRSESLGRVRVTSLLPMILIRALSLLKYHVCLFIKKKRIYLHVKSASYPGSGKGVAATHCKNWYTSDHACARRFSTIFRIWSKTSKEPTRLMMQ